MVNNEKFWNIEVNVERVADKINELGIKEKEQGLQEQEK